MRTQVEQACQTFKLDGNVFVKVAPSKRRVTLNFFSDSITSLAIFKTKCNPKDSTVFRWSFRMMIFSKQKILNLLAVINVTYSWYNNIYTVTHWTFCKSFFPRLKFCSRPEYFLRRTVGHFVLSFQTVRHYYDKSTAWNIQGAKDILSQLMPLIKAKTF